MRPTECNGPGGRVHYQRRRWYDNHSNSICELSAQITLACSFELVVFGCFIASTVTAFLFGAKCVIKQASTSDQDSHLTVYRMANITAKTGLTRHKMSKFIDCASTKLPIDNFDCTTQCVLVSYCMYCCVSCIGLHDWQ